MLMCAIEIAEDKRFGIEDKRFGIVETAPIQPRLIIKAALVPRRVTPSAPNVAAPT